MAQRVVRLIPRLILACSVLVLSSCAMSFDATTLGVPARLSSAATDQPQGERFKVGGRVVWGLWGLVRLSQPKLEQALAHQVTDANELADITIKSRVKVPDILFTAITLGLISTRSVEIEGVVVR